MWGLLIALIIIAGYVLYDNQRAETPQIQSSELTPEIIERYYTVPEGRVSVTIDQEAINKYYSVK